jgi:AAA domain
MTRISLGVAANSGWTICLVGFPGVGKLTIARALSRSIEATVVDNHWINDPILRLLPKTNSAVPEAVWPQVAKVRSAVLETIATLAPQESNFIFTYAGSNEDDADRAAFEEYRNAAMRRSACFLAVRLLCSEDELVRRIQSVERRGRKLTDPGEAIENFRNFSPLDPNIPESLTLDVTHLSADEAAARIIERLKQSIS